MKLKVGSFALACAILMGLGLFALTWWIMAFEGATGEVTIIGKVYRGYEISPVGSFIGFLWAFADGLIGGAVFAWFYNFLGVKKTRVVYEETLEKEVEPGVRVEAPGPKTA